MSPPYRNDNASYPRASTWLGKSTFVIYQARNPLALGDAHVRSRKWINGS
jgi:hypothetical protein